MQEISNFIFVKGTVSGLWQEHAMTWIRDVDENGNELLYLCPWTVKHGAAVCGMKKQSCCRFELNLSVCLSPCLSLTV